MHWRALLLSLAVAPCVAFAQDEMGLGLDLTEPSVPPEFKPSLGIIGVTAVPAMPEEEPVLKARADGVNVQLLPAAMQGEPFSKVMSPEETKTALAADYDAATKCAEAACMQQLAEKLDVDRVIVGQMVYAERETKMSLYGYDRGKRELFSQEAVSAEQAMERKLSGFAGLGKAKSQAQKDREFLAKTTGPIYSLIGNLKTALGTLSVRSYEPDVEVTLNGKKVGTGSFSINLAAGEYSLHAESPNVFPFDTKVAIEPQKVNELALTLTAKPKAQTQVPVVVDKPVTTAPIYKRPGLFVALAGAVALGVGAAIGSSAKGIERRATQDENGVYNVTRAEVVAAKNQAMVGNVLMGVGGAALAGGAIWMFVAPGTQRMVDEGPVTEPEGAGGGFTVGVGGTF